MPPAAGNGHKQEVFTLVIDDDRIRAGTKRDAARLLLEVVLVVDVERVAVGLLAGELRATRNDGEENEQAAVYNEMVESLLHVSNSKAKLEHRFLPCHGFEPKRDVLREFGRLCQPAAAGMREGLRFPHGAVAR